MKTYLPDITKKDCYDCSRECEICSGPYNTQCSKCNPDYFITGTTCLDDCDPKWNNKKSWDCVTKCPADTFIYLDFKICDLICDPPLKIYILSVSE